MTDYTKLIERANKATEWAGTVAADILKESVFAIEALQGEVERLNRESQNLSNQLGDCDRARLAMKAERDALQAKLDELQRQEPVAHFGSAYVNENGVHITTVLGPVAIPQDAKLYAAPKALEPLTDEQRLAIFDEVKWEGEDGWEYYYGDVINAVERAHGITKGTP